MSARKFWSNEFVYHARSLIRIFYPEACVICASPLRASEDRICLHCVKTLSELEPPHCRRCSVELPPFGNTGGTCSGCRSRRFFFNRTWALYAYNEALKTILHQVKFRKRRFLMNFFKQKLIRFGNSVGSQFDMILPVPMDRQRNKERGFNQASLIAAFVSQGAQKPLREICLRKIRSTAPQSLLPRDERLVNPTGSFEARYPFLFRGRQVLLVDDVFTTGATVNECARVLKEQGASRVSVFCLARTRTDIL